jgi:hypothetical protein
MEPSGVRRPLLISAAVLSTFLLAPVGAQYEQYDQSRPAPETYATREWEDDIPAHLSFVEGSVTLERDNKLEPAETNLALLAGDRLRTRGGRVEILFADGSTLCLDEHTELDLLSESLARLITGRLHLALTRSTTAPNYRIDAPAASVWIRAAGEYRVDVRENRRQQVEVDLGVIRGSAELVNAHGRTLVRAGTHAVATAELAPSLPYVANSADWDEFDRWIDRQRDARLGTHSTRYLPNEVSYYSGAFDNHGSWDYLPAHGYVWYPRVSSGWRPYSQGRWSFSAHFGWFWIGIDRWSWPTHHYGRWGHSGGGWYWIPGRRWSPAWVSWAYAPGYVGWCPLGYDGRPVYGFHHVNPWSAWTILPYRTFVPNVWVTQHIVVHNIIPPTIRTQFVERRTAPSVPTIRVPAIDPIRAPTYRGYAVARNSRPAYAGEEEWRRMSPSTGTASTRSVTGASTAGVDRAASRQATQPAANAAQVASERSRVAPGASGVQSPRAEVPRTSVPRGAEISGDESRRAVPRGAPAGRADDDPPSRTVPGTSRTPRPETAAPPERTSGARSRSGVYQPETPRQAPPVNRTEPDRAGSARSRGGSYEPEPPRQPAPVYRAEPERGPSRVPDRAAPRESTPRFGGEPPRQSAPPPPSSGSERGPSRAPDRAGPRESSPPPSAAPPPSRGRGSESAPPASSRGGGSESRGVARGRGGV